MLGVGAVGYSSPRRRQTKVDMNSLPHRSWHRSTFICAGLYNLAWGAYSLLDPQWFFRFAGLPLSNHPEIFACLGMVIGLYGALYLRVAYAPESGGCIALIGLVGKVLGPIGAVALICRGDWPVKAIALCVANDFVWWFPFALYLRDYRIVLFRLTADPRLASESEDGRGQCANAETGPKTLDLGI